MMSYKKQKLWPLLFIFVNILASFLVIYNWQQHNRTVIHIFSQFASYLHNKPSIMCFKNPINISTRPLLSENREEFLVNYSSCRHLIKQTDRPLDLPLVTSAFFRSLGDAIIETDHENISNYTTRSNDIIYIGQEHYSDFIDYLPSISANFILISHWNDLNITLKDYRIIIDNPYLIVWFSTNIIDDHPKLRIIPQGQWPEGLYGSHPLHTFRDLAFNLIPFAKRKILLFTSYWEFWIRWSGRQQLSRQLCAQFPPNRSDIICESKNLVWKDYMKKMRNSKFVISPTGRGLDCFRTWEALLVGAVPIVLNSPVSRRLYADMPVMIVDDYSELSIETLMKFETTLTFRKGTIAPRYKLWARYWLEQIGAYLPRIDSSVSLE